MANARSKSLFLSSILLSISLEAQIPEGIFATRIEGLRQTGPHVVVADEHTFGVAVFFADAVPQTTVVSINNAGGEKLTVPRDSPTEYSIEFTYPDRSSLDAEFPVGAHAVEVNGVLYPFQLSAAPPEADSLRVTNFQELQSVRSSQISITYTPLPLRGTHPWLRISLDDADGNELRNTADLEQPLALLGPEGDTSFFKSDLSPGNYTGRVFWAPLNFSAHANNVTRFAEATATLLSFPVVIADRSPQIIAPPQSTTVQYGADPIFMVEAEGEGEGFFLYRWYYRPTLNAEAVSVGTTTTGSFTTNGEDGYYFVRISNPYGETESSPAKLTIIPREGVRIHVRNSPENFEDPLGGFRNSVAGTTSDHQDGFWIANGNKVQYVSADKVVSTVAGDDRPGHQDGQGTDTLFGGSQSVAISDLAWDRSERLGVTDTGSQTIRTVTLSGEVSTIAGRVGIRGLKDGIGSEAEFDHPQSITYDHMHQQWVVADQFGRVLRWVSPTGETRTLVGTIRPEVEVGVDGVGDQVRFAPAVLDDLFVSAEGDYLFFDHGRLRSIDPLNQFVSTLASAPPDSTLAQTSHGRLFSYPEGSMYLLTQTGLYRINRSQLTGEPEVAWPMNFAIAGGWNNATFDVGHPTLAPNGKFYGFSSNGLNLVEMQPPSHVRANDAADQSTGAARLSNLSVRTRIEPTRSLIAGFVNRGNANRPMIIRGVGPTLEDFGVMDSLPDPKLTLRQGSTSLASNAKWRTDDGASFGGFPLRVNGSDAVILADIQSGAHTVELASADDRNGVALMEVYSSPDAQLDATPTNLSARGWVIDGEPLIAGFVLSGTNPRIVLIRGIGPTLADFGVLSPLSNPNLRLYRGAQIYRFNENWNDPFNEGVDIISPTFERAGAFPLEADSLDSAIVAELSPGAYTVHLNNTPVGKSGEALIEIYLLQ